jgi:hypothetical protein
MPLNAGAAGTVDLGRKPLPFWRLGFYFFVMM